MEWPWLASWLHIVVICLLGNQVLCFIPELAWPQISCHRTRKRVAEREGQSGSLGPGLDIQFSEIFIVAYPPCSCTQPNTHMYACSSGSLQMRAFFLLLFLGLEYTYTMPLVLYSFPPPLPGFSW